jgi:hypothetical protein
MKSTTAVAALVALSLLALAWGAPLYAGDGLRLDGDFSIELEAHWAPLTDTVYKFERRYAIYQDWKPAEKRASYSAADFRPFLPPAGTSLAVGDTWRLDAEHFLPFLRQFHPGATDELHHGVYKGQSSGISAPGAWACLRSLGPDRAEVLMRVHAEFVLDGDGTPGETTWLTPAQFEGRMVIDRRRGVVTAFTLALPDQSANVDLNLPAYGRTIADIGRIPRMELVGGDALPAATAGADEISLDEARHRLAPKFYRFVEIDWRTLEEGLAESKATGRPLHVLLLFGSLTDESC